MTQRSVDTHCAFRGSVVLNVCYSLQVTRVRTNRARLRTVTSHCQEARPSQCIITTIRTFMIRRLCLVSRYKTGGLSVKLKCLFVYSPLVCFQRLTHNCTTENIFPHSPPTLLLLHLFSFPFPPSLPLPASTVDLPFHLIV